MTSGGSLDIDAVLAVLRRFSQLEGQKQPNEMHGYGTVAASKIELSYSSRSPIPLLLPAAPFKNSSPLKVLDTKNPDFAEELGLARLDHLCSELAKVYRYGAELTMVSDGPVYNDLLCIPGSDFYDYGIRLRKIAADQEFTRIRFRRLADVLGIADGDSLSKDEYIALADTCRAEMEARFLPDQSEVKEKIETHKDTNLTYQAYVKLTDEDLRWGPDLDPEIKNDRERYTEETKKVAVKMTQRLLAYERALEAAFPDHVRLSIHPSTGESKIPVPLIPQLNGFGLQPWHCCVVVTAQGRYVTGHFKDYQHSDNYEVIQKDGRPFFLREKNDDFNWPEHIKLHHVYGGKVIVENTLLEDMELTTEWKVKLANLALRFKSVEVQGFQI